MEYITSDLHAILSFNKDRFNLEVVDITKKINHCTVFIDYMGKELKKKSSLNYHIDYVYYSVSDGKFAGQSNSQVESTPGIIYSLDDIRTLNWKSRHI